ncbi:MAG: alanine racemase [Roseburia sp.]|nr:alanine racemase [Anaeroplasma bactoclasticum]MCM1196093.1 alanine racemase [Roseburia sp.]MCM1557333.1 alanine racemase [Anaeroplasma bactoclasticum]
MHKIKEEILERNIRTILKTNRLMLVVKDNAYGFGINRVVSLAKKLWVKDFAVKSIEEGKLVKSIYSEANVLVLGKIKKSDIIDLKKYNLIPTINDYDDYITFKENKIPCHLAIDTGMNRFGMKSGYLAIINDSIVKAIYTHCYNNQNRHKIKFMERLSKNYLKPIHIGGSIAYNQTGEMLRVGKMVYENALYFSGQIVNMKHLKKGETIGYDGLYQAPNDVIIGVCNIGYSDGLNLFYHGNVQIKKKYYSVVGRCCMDHCFILVDEDVQIEDEVEFFGKTISEDQFIEYNHMTKYEMFLQINQQRLTN